MTILVAIGWALCGFYAVALLLSDIRRGGIADSVGDGLLLGVLILAGPAGLLGVGLMRDRGFRP